MIGAAITNHRVLGPAEARLMALAGLMFLLVAILAVFWPRVVVVPLAAIGVWIAAALFVRAWRLWRGVHGAPVPHGCDRDGPMAAGREPR
jgi:cardiolipin synthase